MARREMKSLIPVVGSGRPCSGAPAGLLGAARMQAGWVMSAAGRRCSGGRERGPTGARDRRRMARGLRGTSAGGEQMILVGVYLYLAASALGALGAGLVAAALTGRSVLWIGCPTAGLVAIAAGLRVRTLLPIALAMAGRLCLLAGAARRGAGASAARCGGGSTEGVTKNDEP